MKGEREWNSFLLRKIQVYNINYALLVRSQGVLSQIVAGCGLEQTWDQILRGFDQMVTPSGSGWD